MTKLLTLLLLLKLIVIKANKIVLISRNAETGNLIIRRQYDVGLLAFMTWCQHNYHTCTSVRTLMSFYLTWQALPCQAVQHGACMCTFWLNKIDYITYFNSEKHSGFPEKYDLAWPSTSQVPLCRRNFMYVILTFTFWLVVWGSGRKETVEFNQHWILQSLSVLFPKV